MKRRRLSVFWRPFVALFGVLGFLGLLPAPMQLDWLRWLANDMGPQHPHLREVLLEILQLEERCGA